MSLLSASTAAAARTEFFGIVQGQLDGRDLEGMQAAKVRTERFELGWKAVEPTEGSFNWDSPDRFIGALAAHGIRPVPFVWRSPSWVARNPAYPPLDTHRDRQGWRNFLKAAVARYGNGGSYWSNGYRERYGAEATPLPIESWQVWNEPNLKKFFNPDGSDQQSVQKYARLLRMSHDAIKSQDPQARVVLAGMPGYPPRGGLRAWGFLDRLYELPGTASDFDAAALHPYASNVYGLRIQLQQVRAVMKEHGDQSTPLWLTELGWGSDPPDRWGINQGMSGQQQLLRESFRLILANRKAWNVQRLFWFLWRDPAPDSAFAHRCSFCGSAGLLRHNRNPKPAFTTFKGFSAETTPPRVTITSGPGGGSFINNPSPAFTFTSNEAGSTFECRLGATSFKTCSSPYTVPRLEDGTRTFFVKAIDVAGNESQVRWRSFTVDTTAPTVTISSGPGDGSISSNPSPTFRFNSSESVASLRCELDGGGLQDCSSPFTAPGLADGSHTFRVRAKDMADNIGLASRTWTVDTTEPTVTISSGPDDGSISSDRSPSFEFASGEPDVSFRCKLDGGGFRRCSSPFSASGLADGSHEFQVEARDMADNTDVASRTWSVDGPADVSITAGPENGDFTRDPTPSFAFSSLDSNPDLRCRIDAAAFASCASPFTSSALPDGDHRFTVKATDTSQHTVTDWREFTVDTTAAAVRIKGRHKVKTRRRRASALFILQSSEQVARRCRVDSRRFKPCSWRYRTPKLHRGTHRLKVKATDRAGNVSTKRKWFKVAKKRG